MNYNTFPDTTTQQDRYGRFMSVVDQDPFQLEAETQRIREETDATVIGNLALRTAAFLVFGGPNIMPLTEAVVLEAVVGTTEIADRHKIPV
jgi:hypothetical protein